MRAFGRDLQVGDTIEVWFGAHRDTITELRPYAGPYADNILEGARIAKFALFRSGMTIEADAIFTVLNRTSEAA